LITAKTTRITMSYDLALEVDCTFELVNLFIDSLTPTHAVCEP